MTNPFTREKLAHEADAVKEDRATVRVEAEWRPSVDGALVLVEVSADRSNVVEHVSFSLFPDEADALAGALVKQAIKARELDRAAMVKKSVRGKPSQQMTLRARGTKRKP